MSCAGVAVAEPREVIAPDQRALGVDSRQTTLLPAILGNLNEESACKCRRLPCGDLVEPDIARCARCALEGRYR